jgi:hypothetical protein
MGKMADKITIDIKQLEREFRKIPSVSLTKPVAHGVINGRNYQIQVTLTTDEDEFIGEENPTTNAE